MVVPARDAAATLERAVACLAAQQLDVPYEVVVVDDGSLDATAAIASAFGPPVRVVEGAGRGAAEARNRGVAAATGRVLAFTDADCFAPPGWLAAGLAGMERFDLLQGAVEPDPSAPPQAYEHSLYVPARSGLFETANLFVDRAWFDRVGGFEDVVDTAVAQGRFGEDVWLGWRAERLGARIGFSAEALTYHARIRRSAGEYVAERRRLRHFPALVGAVPELRAERGCAWLFLSRRSAAFDLALTSAVVAALSRRPALLMAVLPYVAAVLRRLGLSRPALVEVAADATGFWALVRGSAQARVPVL